MATTPSCAEGASSGTRLVAVIRCAGCGGDKSEPRPLPRFYPGVVDTVKKRFGCLGDTGFGTCYAPVASRRHRHGSVHPKLVMECCGRYEEERLRKECVSTSKVKTAPSRAVSVSVGP